MNRWTSLIAASAFGLISFSVHAAGNAEAGKQKSQLCQTCHGADGNCGLVLLPSEYKSGARKNPIMTGFAANLSERDMEDIAAYFAGQQNGLAVKR